MSSWCKESPSGDEEGSEPSSELSCSVTLTPEFPHRKRSLLPSSTVCSSQHKLAGDEKPTTDITFLTEDLQMRHVRAGVCFTLNTTNNLLWNKEPPVPSHKFVEHPSTALAREDGAKTERLLPSPPCLAWGSGPSTCPSAFSLLMISPPQSSLSTIILHSEHTGHSHFWVFISLDFSPHHHPVLLNTKGRPEKSCLSEQRVI